jgi:hypothetical protein
MTVAIASPPAHRQRAGRARRWQEWLARVVPPLVVLGCVAFTFVQLHPALLLSGTLDTGGDTAAHVALPMFMRNHLLPHLEITGWYPGWYDGLPLYTFYFPLPPLAVALASYVVPYAVAFKLMTAAGLLLMPPAAWLLGRLFGLSSAEASVLAVGAVGFLFDQSFTIDGGNVASTMAGEFSYTIGLMLALVFLGVAHRGLLERRWRALAAGLLAAVVLCHVVPALFAIEGALFLVLFDVVRHRSLRALSWAIPVGVVAFGLSAFWSIPFVAYLGYTTSLGFSAQTHLLSHLFPHENAPWLVAAAVGAAGSLLRRRPLGCFLVALGAAQAVSYVLAPSGQLYDGRFLPLWFVCVYLLAALGALEVALAAAGAVGWLRHGGPFAQWRSARPAEGWRWRVVTPLLSVGVGLVLVAVALGEMPGWFPIGYAGESFVNDWSAWNYSGYQAKASWPEYHALMDLMGEVGHRYGCGQSTWEYSASENRFGSPMALMILPYWTKGCIGSMEGLFFESSATTPFHFLDQAELSEHPSEVVSGLPYGPPDVRLGIEHLQLLGVRYYLAYTPALVAAAEEDPAVRQVGVSGPWSWVSDGVRHETTWHVFEVRKVAPVVSLRDLPAVVAGDVSGEKAWLAEAVPWYLHPSDFSVPLAASGPASWPRVAPGGSAPVVPTADAGVSDIHQTTQSVSFDVRRTGTPVLVHVSYFPAWQVSGAKGPYRVSPNLMVVVPIAHHVELHFGRTGLETAMDGLSAASVLGLVGLFVVDRRRRRAGVRGTGAHHLGRGPLPG